MSKYVISGPYFPVFGLNTEEYGPEKTPYLDNFHAVICIDLHCTARLAKFQTSSAMIIVRVSSDILHFLSNIFHTQNSYFLSSSEWSLAPWKYGETGWIRSLFLFSPINLNALFLDPLSYHANTQIHAHTHTHTPFPKKWGPFTFIFLSEILSNNTVAGNFVVTT